MFISMAYLILDHVRATVTLSRAGHDAPAALPRRDAGTDADQAARPGPRN